MSNKTSFPYILLVGSIALWFAAVSVLTELPHLFQAHKQQTGTSSSAVSNKSLESMSLALREQELPTYFTYTSDFESPFRKRGQSVKRPRTHSASPVPERQKLFLKGILLKEKPLAIIEDERGETYIRSIGENVLEQEILKIQENKVVLRDRRGTYEIVVQEK